MDKNDLRMLLNQLLWLERKHEDHPHRELIFFTCHVLMILHQSAPRKEIDTKILFTISMSGGKVLDSVCEEDLNKRVAQLLKTFTVYAASTEPEVQKSAARIVKDCCFEILLVLKQPCAIAAESIASNCHHASEGLFLQLKSFICNKDQFFVKI